jgi:ABC-2 type transport system ATP-binding protein
VELLAGPTVTLVRGLDPGLLRTALAGARLTVREARTDGALLVSATPEAVGRAAAGSGTVLTELRPADDGGLERLFLTLTSPQEVAA